MASGTWLAGSDRAMLEPQTAPEQVRTFQQAEPNYSQQLLVTALSDCQPVTTEV